MQKQTIDSKQLENQVWKILAKITDPEVPVLTILDLGIVREVVADDSGVQISITPTYSGCHTQCCGYPNKGCSSNAIYRNAFFKNYPGANKTNTGYNVTGNPVCTAAIGFF